jgi:hypothetical protein
MVAQMRHLNSSEERAKRDELPEGPARAPHRGFMHYNHPDQVAKREREGAQASAVVVPQRQPRRVVEATGESAAIVPAGAPAPRKRPMAPLSGEEPQRRLELLEEVVYTFVEDPTQAREFRMNMSNVGAMVEAQRELIARLRAAEGTIEQLVARANEEGDDEVDEEDDDEPADGLGPARSGDTTPPPADPATSPQDAPTKPTSEPVT